MSHRTAFQPNAWGPAAATTAAAIIALAAGLLIGTALAWVTVTHNPHVTAQTLVGSAIVVDVACMAEITRRLLRGQP